MNEGIIKMWMIGSLHELTEKLYRICDVRPRDSKMNETPN